MLVLHAITTPRTIGFGLALASAGLLITACTDHGSGSAASTLVA